jgi:hypothetical protein
MRDQSGHGIDAPSTFQPVGVSNFLPSGSMYAKGASRIAVRPSLLIRRSNAPTKEPNFVPGSAARAPDAMKSKLAAKNKIRTATL